MSETVLDRSALENSPLADLHLIANEIGLDGYRRLRKGDLIDAIVARQGGEDAPKTADDDANSDDAKPRNRGRGRRRGGSPGGSGAEDTTTDTPDETVEGPVELQANGSGFVRRDGADGDVYVSASQVKRCELVAGDVIGGPVRPPRRSERYPSMVRVETINGKPVDEVAEGTRFEELGAAFPAERLELGGEDPTVNVVEWLTPFGKGSRVLITGGRFAGKSELLRRIAAALAGRDNLELLIALAGVRPEELPEWNDALEPVAAAPIGLPGDAQTAAADGAVEQGKRIAARGGDAVVVIDALDCFAPGTARRLLGAARNIPDGGSLTIIAAGAEPLGGETTVVALDAQLTGLRRFPNLDLTASETMRPELLVGEDGAAKIAAARAEAAVDAPQRAA